MMYVFAKDHVQKQLPAEDYCVILDWYVRNAEAGQPWHYLGCIHPSVGGFPVVIDNDPIQIFLGLWKNGKEDLFYYPDEALPFGLFPHRFEDLEEVLEYLEAHPEEFEERKELKNGGTDS